MSGRDVDDTTTVTTSTETQLNAAIRAIDPTGGDRAPERGPSGQ
jgi:hypothetical protein